MKILNVLFLLIISTASIAQQQTKPCELPESQQFNFWIGEWICEWKAPEGVIKNGSNEIKKILGGCVIEENFNGNPGAPLIGKSHSVYSPALKKWKQTWVDNNGSYLDFEGGMDGDKMILSRTVIRKDGISFMQRMVWYNITDNKFDWNWERSDDEGQNWNVNWHIEYKRKM